MAEVRKGDSKVFFPPLTSRYIPGSGTLTMLNQLPSDFLSDFEEQFLKTQPWLSPGRSLPSSYRIELVDVGNMQIIRKPSNDSLPELYEYTLEHRRQHVPRARGVRTLMQRSLPLAKFAKAATMQRRYEAAYPGESIGVEMPIAAFHNEKTGKLITFYRYYPEIYSSSLPPEVFRAIIEQLEKLQERLPKLDIFFHDGFQYLLTNSTDGSGIPQIIIIDHEDIGIRGY